MPSCCASSCCESPLAKRACCSSRPSASGLPTFPFIATREAYYLNFLININYKEIQIKGISGDGLVDAPSCTMVGMKVTGESDPDENDAPRHFALMPHPMRARLDVTNIGEALQRSESIAVAQADANSDDMDFVEAISVDWDD